MTCSECLAGLGAQFDDSDLAVARHLQECAACRAQWQLLQAALLSLDNEPAPPAPDLRPGLRQALAAERRQAAALEPILRRERRLACGFGLLVITGLAVYSRLRWPGWQLPSLPGTAGAWLAQLHPGAWLDPRTWLHGIPNPASQLAAQAAAAWQQVRQAFALLTPPALPLGSVWLLTLAALAALLSESLTRRYAVAVAPGGRS